MFEVIVEEGIIITKVCIQCSCISTAFSRWASSTGRLNASVATLSISRHICTND